MVCPFFPGGFEWFWSWFGGQRSLVYILISLSDIIYSICGKYPVRQQWGDDKISFSSTLESGFYFGIM